MFTLEELEAAAALVHAELPPTPAYAWPLLAKRTGIEVWVKHENHTPTGAFKVRGGIVYMHELRARHPSVRGVVSATRGNHGQSIARAAAAAGLAATIVVPHGNSAEKNAAMRGFGAELVEHGADFDEAKAEAARLAEEQAAALENNLKTRERIALERIARADAEALKEVRETAVDIAIAATRKLIADNLDATRGGALIDAAIAEMPRRLN